MMRVDGNMGSELHYEPNSYGNWTDHPQIAEPIQEGGAVYHYDFRMDDHDYYTQPGLLFRSMSQEQQRVLFENTARNMGDSTRQIKHRHINHCYMADPEYGKGVAEALSISMDEVDLTPMKSDSHDAWLKDNARGASDLNVPTMSADPVTAKDLPHNGRDTNVEEPKSLFSWEDDPQLL
jgi:catalase